MTETSIPSTGTLQESSRPKRKRESRSKPKKRYSFGKVTFLLFVSCLFVGVHAYELQAQVLNASDGTPVDEFGWSAGLSGNIGFVGAYRDDDNGTDSGAAYVFGNLDLALGTVNELVKLTASDAAADDRFGWSVNLSGNTGLVGAYRDDDNEFNSGSAYVFRNLDSASGTVNESVKLITSDGENNDQFGWSVGLSGNIGLVGARSDDENGTNSGSAYVFRNLDSVTGTVNESVKLTASDGASNDNFGWSVSLSGNTGLVGANIAGDNGFLPGSAYVFRNLDSASGIINESVKLTASDGAHADHFGYSVSIFGNTGLVGARWNDDNGTDSGSAYVFRDLDSATGAVNESVKLVALDGAVDDQFGESVSLSGTTGLVGAINDDDRGDNSGSVYIFRNLDTATGMVNESVKLTASDGRVGARFGVSAGLDGDRFIIGASFGDGVATLSGTAYTGTVSSMTTLDFGNNSAVIDGISFESRTDWIIGENTSNNDVLLREGNTASVLAVSKSVFIGGNAGSNENTLTIAGTIEANVVNVGAAGNSGNLLALEDSALHSIVSILLAHDNSISIEGELTDFTSLDSYLGTTDLLVIGDGLSELITASNFDTLLLTNFDSSTGFTHFTALSSIPEPSTASFLILGLAGLSMRRRKQQVTTSFIWIQ